MVIKIGPIQFVRDDSDIQKTKCSVYTDDS